MKRIVALVAVLALAGCGAKGTSAPAAPASAAPASAVPSADPLGAFRAAVAKTNQTSTTFTISTDLGGMGTLKGTGATDPVAKTGQFHADVTIAGQAVPIDGIRIGPDLYLKAPPLLSKSGKWGHVDLTRVKSLSKLGLDSSGSPTNLGALESELVDVKQTGPLTYTGTVDRTKSPGLTGDVSEALKSVPFEAKVDDQGRVTSLTIRTPTVGSTPPSTTTIELTGFGKPVSVSKPPASSVEEIPASFYN